MKITPLENWIMNKVGIEHRSREAIEEHQLRKLRETLYYAKRNSSFYKEHLKDISEDEFISLEALQKVPFTYPHNVGRSPQSFLCVPLREIKRIVTLSTSGTSGEEKRIFFTEEDLELTIDFFKSGMSCLTDEMDRVLVLLPGNAYGSIGDLLKKALTRSGIPCFVHGVLKDPEDVAKLIEEESITCIVGIPMQVLYLSRVKSEVFRNRIKKVLLSTDYVPEVLISELTQKYDCKVFTHYGMTEMGYGGGVECKALNGYHMREGDLYFEIINPHTGEAARDGEYGEVVFTTLTRQAMPLIRYRTGDVAAFSKTECPCGTFLKTMKRVKGRIDNRVVFGEKQFIYLRELDEVVLAFEEVMDYKAYLSEENILVLEITTQDIEAFQFIKNKVAFSINNLLNNNNGYGFNTKITSNQEFKPAKLANSMIKRKLLDYRKGGGI